MANKQFKKIIPVILSGGMGSRLWPMSRESYPKQFLKLSSDKYSLIQKTIERINGIEGFEPPTIIGNRNHRFLIAENIMEMGLDGISIILEPCARNTAPALAATAYYLKEIYKDALILVLPSDHIIRDNETFIKGVQKAAEIANNDKLVTFGIKPEHPETGYGYIKYGKEIKKNTAYEIECFVEKPDIKTAEKYVKSGDYAWNSGMFLFPIETFLKELEKFEPVICEHAANSVKNREDGSDFITLNEKDFCSSPKESIDYAVMERTDKGAVVPLDCGWNDAGAWDSLWKLGEKDDNGNVINGDSYIIDAKNNYISCTNGPKVSAIGVNDLAIISTKDSVLVTSQKCAQDVKKLVELIKNEEKGLVENHTRVFRPWGYYDSIDNGRRHQVKRINVRPGAKLSLQMHYHRAEHWIVVRGTAKVTLEDKEELLSENQSIYIPCGITHRIENPGKIDLDIIEVQSGTYLGEDDIVRFEDKYGR